jgi:hypothetical protein
VHDHTLLQPLIEQKKSCPIAFFQWLPDHELAKYIFEQSFKKKLDFL